MTFTLLGVGIEQQAGSSLVQFPSSCQWANKQVSPQPCSRSRLRFRPATAAVRCQWEPCVANSALSVYDMRGRYKINERRGRRGEADSSALLGDTAAGSPVPGAAVRDVGGTKKGRREDVLSLRKISEAEHLLLKDFIAALVLLQERCSAFLFVVCVFYLRNS